MRNRESDTLMTEFLLNLPDETLERLQSEAKRLNVTLDVVVNTAIARYLEEDDDATLSKEAILESLRISMKQALAGNFRPADEVLDEIEREMHDDADQS